MNFSQTLELISRLKTMQHACEAYTLLIKAYETL